MNQIDVVAYATVVPQEGWYLDVLELLCEEGIIDNKELSNLLSNTETNEQRFIRIGKA